MLQFFPTSSAICAGCFLSTSRTTLARAIAANPSQARLRLQAGRLQVELCMPDAALASFRHATDLDPTLSAAWLEAGRCHASLGDVTQAAKAFSRATEFARERDAAMQALLDVLPAETLACPSGMKLALRAREAISIITCSVDDARFTRASASFARALADWPHEIVRIADARSLAEGYNRGLGLARGPIVVFTHDDVEILADDFGHRLSRHLQSCEIVGVAGAERVAGPAWSHAGHPWLHGCVVYPSGDGYEITVYSRRAPLATGLIALDGVFIATRRDIARRVDWDAETFGGFHGYDIDFSLRAAKMGLRLAAATDLGVVHHSRGHYDDAWHKSAKLLMTKHPELGRGQSKATHVFTRKLPSREHIMALVAEWSNHSTSNR